MDNSKRKDKELELVKEREKFNVALENSDIYVWEFDIKNRRSIQQPKAMGEYAIPKVIEGVPESVIALGLIAEESKEAYIDVHEQLIRGAKKSEAEVCYVNKDGSKRWKKIKYVTLTDEQGKAEWAIGCATDLEPIKELERRYDKGLAYREVLKKDAIGSFRFNLTKNWCGEGESDRTSVAPLQADGTVDGFFEYNYSQNASEEIVAEFKEIFNRKSLLEAFYKGKSSLSFEHPYRLAKNKVRWICTRINMMENPHTGDVEAIIYAVDIHEQKVSQEAMRTVAAVDYDYILYLDAADDSYVMFANENGAPLPPKVSDSYESEMIRYAQKYVVPDQQCRVVREMSLKHVQQQLEHMQVYAVFLDMYHEDGSVAHKKLRYSYVDKRNNTILLTRRDITDIIEKEERQQEDLKNALVAAQQASAAKSEFLSRVSHEIRTPMNAIIGMSALAAQYVDDPKRVSDYLAKVGISARFLLSLINDILDMSRIESGRMFIEQEPISFEKFISGINAICYAQAVNKGVDYDAVITSFTENCYVGDAMKLQQVLINIISNGIKFTPQGGKVRFMVGQEPVKDGKALVRFTINDTGVGISESFLPHLFEPFAQQHTGNTSMYGGTGLGLAICKNLIELMGGTISVNSIEGIGSEFVVEVKLGVLKESSGYQPALELRELNVLIVDDDVVVCQHTEQILEGMGMKVEWINSGKQAVEVVREKWKESNCYDTIFIDWKMPEMDGIETTRELRKVVGPDVTIIIMTAYDWASIETEAKEAGVNVLMPKPLFKTSVLSTFEKIYHNKQEESYITATKIYDFTGKRVLLVEDHILNIEVAKRLLEVKNFQVEVAENGLKCIESFAKHDAGYYDAILMDIRMPVMDGITAARSIRHMENEDAKTIPIIAMTANAFDEDVKETKLAGMNAHLVKPIEPQLLYQTLNQLLKK